MQGCRTAVVADSVGKGHARQALIGETCHIVAKSPGGPRGNSRLSKDDRDRYPNLILLCANHHILIDQNPHDWPIELLHQVKADHEHWVETNLRHTDESKSRQWYVDLVASATQKLHLRSWDVVSDATVRSCLPAEFVDGTNEFGEIVFRAVWPGEKPELEESIKELAQRVARFVEHFLSSARLHDNAPTWVEDKTWKQTWWSQERYDDHVKRSIAWQQGSFDLLMNVVFALNEFAESIRTHLLPEYFITEGKFTVFDGMGLTNDLVAIHYLPTQYRCVRGTTGNTIPPE